MNMYVSFIKEIIIMKWKITSGLVSAVMLIASLGTPAVPQTSVTAAELPNYAEALQKSLYFYECQQAGPLPQWNRVEWRADSTMTDEVKGGWYDAGDHVKFNLPMSYSASMLAWGLYQYPDGVEKSGEMTNYVNNLKYVLDYLAECDRGDEAVYQVGNGQKDHTWWGPVELYEYGMEENGADISSVREIFVASEGCSAVFGDMSAALAAGYCALQGRVDSDTLDSYLEHSKNLFKLADESRSDAVYKGSDAQGFYDSSHFYDELFYASNWLYIATKDSSYLDKAKSYIPNLGTELGTNELKYSWGHCWDDVMQGGMLLYAINTNDSTYISRVKKHVDYWTNSVKELPGGFRWLTTWGSLRYAEAAGFIAAVACDTVLADSHTEANVKFYEDQMNYALGVNPDNRSYVVGFGENSPRNAHHRTAHASWKNDLAIPDENRHILYGALVGGPTESGAYEDDRQNYINNEVATDYNAGFTALLCKMTDKYGGETDKNFPQPEQHDMPEFYVAAKIKTSSTGVDLSLKITNHTAWPARVQDNISYRYFMDLSEIIDAGYSAEDVVLRIDRDQSTMYNGVTPVEVSKPIKYSGNIYYVEVTYADGRAALPISEGRHQCELMLAIVYPNYGSGWVADDDFSNTEILEAEDPIMTEYIPVYVNGELYYGREPDGTFADGGMTVQQGTTKPPVVTTTNPVVTTTAKAPTTTKAVTTTTEVSTTTTSDIQPTTDESGEATTNVPEIVYGDADLDGEVAINDAVAIMCYVSNREVYPIEEQGLINSDVYARGDGISNMDALSVQKKCAQIIMELPES